LKFKNEKAKVGSKVAMPLSRRAAAGHPRLQGQD